MKRKGLSKKIRFEVFKRDSFTCQYCGSKAPDVILEIDHIEPVAKGGKNGIMNLVTACENCNRGKSDGRLSDTSAVSKQLKQMEDLQIQREQMQMMYQWQCELTNIENEAVDNLRSYWDSFISPLGYSLNDRALDDLKKWYRKYGMAEIMESMRICSTTYLKTDKDGKLSITTAGEAFKKIGGVLAVRKSTTDDPERARLYYIRAILRNRKLVLGKWDSIRCFETLRAFYENGIPIYRIEEVAKSCKSMDDFMDTLKDGDNVPHH